MPDTTRALMGLLPIQAIEGWTDSSSLSLVEASMKSLTDPWRREMSQILQVPGNWW